MVRINLLPPEITEKRKAEQWWKYIVFGAVALYALVGIFWFVMFLQVSSRAAEVNDAKQQALSLQTQANAFKIFEDRQQDLKTRQDVANKALAGRIEWSQLLNEVALVLPSDAWLSSLNVDQTKFTITGQSVASVADPSSSGFKPVAKLLVHLGDVAQLENVWLDSSQAATFLDASVSQFTVSADIATMTAGTAGQSSPPSQ